MAGATMAQLMWQISGHEFATADISKWQIMAAGLPHQQALGHRSKKCDFLSLLGSVCIFLEFIYLFVNEEFVEIIYY